MLLHATTLCNWWALRSDRTLGASVILAGFCGPLRKRSCQGMRDIASREQMRRRSGLKTHRFFPGGWVVEQVRKQSEFKSLVDFQWANWSVKYPQTMGEYLQFFSLLKAARSDARGIQTPQLPKPVQQKPGEAHDVASPVQGGCSAYCFGGLNLLNLLQLSSIRQYGIDLSKCIKLIVLLAVWICLDSTCCFGGRFLPSC